MCQRFGLENCLGLFPEVNVSLLNNGLRMPLGLLALLLFLFLAAILDSYKHATMHHSTAGMGL